MSPLAFALAAAAAAGSYAALFVLFRFVSSDARDTYDTFYYADYYAEGGVVLVFLAFLVFWEARRALAFDRRLAAVRGIARAAAPAFAERRRGGGRAAREFGAALLRAGSMLVPVGAAEREKLAGLLRRAGFAHRDALSLYLCAKLAAAVACCVGLAAAAPALFGEHRAYAAISAAGGLVLGGIVPEYVLRALAARRARRMAAALPDALDLAVMCLESGLTFERTLAAVARELAPIEPNLAHEFHMMEAELRVGANRRAVLQEFQGRTEIEGMRDLTASLIQSDRYGTPLGQSFKNIAAAERMQRGARLAAQAERLPVLMTIPMLMFVVPGTIILVAGPVFVYALEALREVSS